MAEHKQAPPPPKLDDTEFVPLKHVLDRWLISAEFITKDGTDLYHANLAALATLKDLYLIDDPKWVVVRDKVFVGIIKDEAQYGTTSVSMGAAVEYFKDNPEKQQVLILNCGTGGTKYGLYTRSPFIREAFRKDDSTKDGQISCLSIPGIGYNCSAYGLPFSRTVQEVKSAVAEDIEKAIQGCRSGGHWGEGTESIAFITGSIRDYYFKTPNDRTELNKTLNGLFASVGVKPVKAEASFFLDQQREGELELLAAQALHQNMGSAGRISKGFVPIVSLGIGRGTAQWSMAGEIIMHGAGMNSIAELAKLGKKVTRALQNAKTWNRLLKSVDDEIKAGNTPVIGLKSGCTLAFTKAVVNGAALKRKFLDTSLPPQAFPPMRLFLAQNSNPNLERVTWTKPAEVKTLDALCAYASVALRANTNFIAAYHENGCRIRELENVRENDLIFFSQGEQFGAPPGLPTKAEKKIGLRCVPLSWIPDRWLIGQDSDHEYDQAPKKVTHATMATLNQLWHFGTPEWNEVREKVHVCFKEEVDDYLNVNTIRNYLVNEMKGDAKENNDEVKLKEKIESELKNREKFVKSNRIDTVKLTDLKQLIFFGVSKPYAEFPKEFVVDIRQNETNFKEKLTLIRGAKLPFIEVNQDSLPQLYLLDNQTNSRAIAKCNEYRTQLRKSLAKAIHQPVVAPQNIRVYFGINSEKDGSACRVSPEWTLSRVCAEAVQVLCPGESGILFTRVFNKMGFEILPENVLTPIGIKEEDTLFLSLGEDFNEEVNGGVTKCTVPAIVTFSLRKMADVDIAAGRINIVFDFTMLVPREGVPKEVRRDGFLAQHIRATINQEDFSLSDPISTVVNQSPPSSVSHITSHTDKPTRFYKWKARPTINVAINSSDDLLHQAIRECPFDSHIMHFVTELKPVRTRAYKVAFDIHFMKKACQVRDKEKVDYLPEFDVDWETARVELATRVPIGVERDRWTQSIKDQQLLCVGQEEMMHNIPKANPEWMDNIDGDAYFLAGTGCTCAFEEYPLINSNMAGRLPIFSNFVVCPKKLIADLKVENEVCKVQCQRMIENTSANAFSVMHYSVRIRRDPKLLTLLAVFPVFLLCLLALAIVWQSDGFTDSVANIAAVLLALFAYAPVVRSKLPPSPSVTHIDRLLNYAVVVCFWVLVTAVIQEGVRQNYEIHDDNLNSVLVDGVAAKLYLARVSLISSMFIVLGHVIVFTFFVVKYVRVMRLQDKQNTYAHEADKASAMIKPRADPGRPRQTRISEYKADVQLAATSPYVRLETTSSRLSGL